MLVLGRVKPALGIAVALGVALPAPASGVMTIGSNLAGDPGISFGCPPNTCTFAHQALPPASTAPGGVLAPSDGVVVRWRIKVGDLDRPGGAEGHPTGQLRRTGRGRDGPHCHPGLEFDLGL